MDAYAENRIVVRKMYVEYDKQKGKHKAKCEFFAGVYWYLYEHMNI